MTGGPLVLLEREEQLGRVRAALDEAVRGRGSLLTIRGPAGIGKTSLLRVAAEQAQAGGFTLLGARGRQLERELAWGVARHLFSAVTDDLAAGRFGLRGSAALAAAALGLPREATGGAAAAGLPRGAAAGGPGLDLAGMLHGLYWLTSDLAEARAPLLIAVDDVHWADAPSLRYLAYLAARVADLPVAVLLSVRSGEATGAEPLIAAIEGEPAAGRVALQELSLDASATLVAGVLGEGAHEEFRRACHASTGGNPFFLGELLERAAADGLAPTGANAPLVARITPETVAHSVLLRLSLLPADARALAAAVATLGGGCALDTAAALAGLDAPAAAAAADALAGAEILLRRTPLDFAHPIVRAAVYEDLPPFERGRWHARGARLLHEHGAEPERVAAQLLACEPARDEWVVQRLTEAAERALAGASPETAVSFLRRALRERPGPPPPELTWALGSALALAHDPAAIEQLRAAFAAAPGPAERAPVALQLAPLLFHAGRFAEAMALCEQALGDGAAHDDETRLRLLATLVAAGTLDSALVGEARRWSQQIGDGLTGDTPARRLALVSQIALRNVSGAPVGPTGELAARAMHGGALLADVTADSPFFSWAATALLFADRFAEAREHLDAGLADARARGSSFGFAVTITYRACLNLRTGALRDAIADARLALDTGALAASPVTTTHATAFLIEALVEAGELDAAERLFAASGAEPAEPFRVGMLLASGGRLALARGDAETALARLRSAAGGIEPATAAVWPWRSSAAVAAHMLGRAEEALALAREELAVCQAAGCEWALAIARRCAGLVEGGEPGIALLAAAAQGAEACGAQLEQAQALGLLGAAQRRAGLRREAVRTLHAAHALALSCGAARTAAAATAELKVAGARPRRRRRPGQETLTPSELRVAELAVAGLSNREIAQALFVSLRTVETHLTHIYRKLGIASRAALAEALGPEARAA